MNEITLPNAPFAVSADVLEKQLDATFDQYIKNNLIPQLEADNVKMPDMWDERDWHTLVMSVVLNWNGVKTVRQLQLYWKRTDQTEKILGANEIKAIRRIRAAMQPYYDEMRELFAQTSSQYFTYAEKAARVERINWWTEQVEDDIEREVIKDSKFNVLNPEFRKALTIYLKLFQAMDREMGVKKYFEHKVVHEQEISFDPVQLQRAAEKLGTTKEALHKALLNEMFDDQLVKPIDVEYEEVDNDKEADVK